MLTICRLSFASRNNGFVGTLEDQYLRRYAEYLEARASVVGKMDDFTRDRNARDRIVARVRKLPPTSLIEEIGGFQKLIDVLLKCKVCLLEPWIQASSLPC